MVERKRTKLKDLTTGTSYYILEVDTLIDDIAYNRDEYGVADSIKAYSIVQITDNGAFEVDRAYRTIQEALEAWPDAIPPRS